MAKDYYPRANYDDDESSSNAPATVSRVQATGAQSTAMPGLEENLSPTLASEEMTQVFQSPSSINYPSWQQYSQNALGPSIYAPANTAGPAGSHTMAFQRTFKAAPGLNVAIPAPPAPALSARAAGKCKAERSPSPLD